MPNPVAATARTGTGKVKLPYIDCLRGYAILMVIATHVTYAFPELPYPVHLLTSFGWYGVQLFFMASCLTLMMSSAHERARTGSMQVGHFFLRRFLRIAPMYYLAGIFYWWIGSRLGANPAQALTALTFTNSWSPATMPANGGWQMVPGGWSIGVEFTFYFLFPLYFALATTARRALVILLLVLGGGALANSAAVMPLSAHYGATPADNFLFFWFFNQAGVFALAGLVFFAIRKIEATAALAADARRWAGPGMVACLGLLGALALCSGAFSHSLRFALAMPHFLPVIAVFAIAIIAMSQAEPGLFVNRAVAAMGKVSFSAYLLHFAVIDWTLRLYPGLFHVSATGVDAIAAFVVGYAVVVALTYRASSLTYHWVELPMMNLAKRVTRNAALELRNDGLAA